jgi:chromosome segregation ATPase
MNPPSLSVEPGRAKQQPLRMSAGSLSKPQRSNFAAPRPGSAPAAPPSDRKHLESQLIENLRQQVAVLEVENGQLRQRLSQQPQMQMHADPVASHKGQQHHGTASSQRMNLMQRVEELQAEVVDLKQKYARREQEHQVELAEQRNKFIAGGADAFSGSHNGMGGSARGPERADVVQVRQECQRDLDQMKERFATEAVGHEKTIERLRAEARSHEAESEQLIKEKEELTRELIQVKDNARTVHIDLDVAQKQYQDAMAHLNAEQDRRRDVENKERDLKEKLAAATSTSAAEKAQRAEGLETRMKAMSTELHETKFELEKTKVLEARLSQEVQSLLKHKAEREVTDAQQGESMAETSDKVKLLEKKLADVESEREFFRLSTDRLKVENSVLAVKTGQLEAKNNSDRASVLTLERQYTAAIEQVEALRRDIKSKENVYRSIDEHDERLRHQHRVAAEEAEALRKQNADLRTVLADVSAKYDSIKEYGDAIKAEQQLSAALSRLDKTKHEMHNLLQTQVKLSNDLSEVMGDIPEQSMYHTHQRSAMSLGVSAQTPGGRSHPGTPPPQPAAPDQSAIPVDSSAAAATSAITDEAGIVAKDEVVE